MEAVEALIEQIIPERARKSFDVVSFSGDFSFFSSLDRCRDAPGFDPCGPWALKPPGALEVALWRFRCSIPECFLAAAGEATC